jgi:hypothetical protein
MTEFELDMTMRKYYKSIPYDTGLGSVKEAAAVMLMVLFIWMMSVSCGYEIFMK